MIITHCRYGMWCNLKKSCEIEENLERKKKKKHEIEGIIIIRGGLKSLFIEYASFAISPHSKSTTDLFFCVCALMRPLGKSDHKKNYCYIKWKTHTQNFHTNKWMRMKNFNLKITSRRGKEKSFAKKNKQKKWLTNANRSRFISTP
jgi:hypothetical protein